MLRTLVVGIGALALLAVQGGAALACVGGPVNGKTEIEQADIVFTGTAVRLNDRRGEVYSSADPVEGEFVVADSSPLSPLTVAVALVLGAALYLVVGSRRGRNGPGPGRR